MMNLKKALVQKEIEETIEEMRKYKRNLVLARNDLHSYYKSSESMRFINHINYMIRDCESIENKLFKLRNDNNATNGFGGGF